MEISTTYKKWHIVLLFFEKGEAPMLRWVMTVWIFLALCSGDVLAQTNKWQQPGAYEENVALQNDSCY